MPVAVTVSEQSTSESTANENQFENSPVLQFLKRVYSYLFQKKSAPITEADDPIKQHFIQQHHKTTNVVYTKPGSEGYWNRQITESHPRLLFVYGENHRDFLKMRAWFDKEHGELRPQWHYTDQKTTQGNIRGEPNAFPIRTMWYHTIPGSDQYQNWFADRELKINSNVITEDINLSRSIFGG